MPTDHQFVLDLACCDTKGIVHAVSGLPYQAGCKGGWPCRQAHARGGKPINGHKCVVFR